MDGLSAEVIPVLQQLMPGFECAVNDELIIRNPVGSIELPAKAKKPVAPSP